MSDQTTALAIVTPGADGLATLDRAISAFGALGRCGILPKGVGPAEAAALAAMGATYGLDPLQSVWRLHIIEGRPSLPAETMVALVRRHPACAAWRMLESTPERAEYETRRVGDDGPTRLAYTLEEARAAGLAGKGVWRSHPAAMLRARCSSALARIVYPDVVGGLYDPDEAHEAAGAYASQPRPAYVATTPPAEPVRQRHPQEWPAVAGEPVLDADVVEPAHEPAPTVETLGPARAERAAQWLASMGLVEDDIIAAGLSPLRPETTVDAADRARKAAAGWPTKTRVQSSTSERVYELRRLRQGSWTCTCEAGAHTHKGEGSPCHHARTAETRLVLALMPGSARAVVQAAATARAEAGEDAEKVESELVADWYRGRVAP